MKTVKTLYNRLNSDLPFEDKYPEYKMEDNMVHVLYLAPCLNGQGYYRMILPALQLNKTTTHRAIVSGINKWDFNKQFDDYDSPLDARLIHWADYVVLPPMLTDAKYIIDSLDNINPTLQFVMDVDENYLLIGESHPKYNLISEKQKQTLLKNLFHMDVITSPNQAFLEYINRIIEHNKIRDNIDLVYFPNLLSPFSYEDVKASDNPTSDKVRIGIICANDNKEDVLSIQGVLKELEDKYKDKIEIVLFGWNGKVKDQKIEGVKFTHVKPVTFTKYFEKLLGLDLDMALIPFADTAFNTKGKSFIKYLELSAYSIPVVASNKYPFDHVIDHEDTGVLASTNKEWIERISELIDNKEMRQSIGQRALKDSWLKYSYTNENTSILCEMFQLPVY